MMPLVSDVRKCTSLRLDGDKLAVGETLIFSVFRHPVMCNPQMEHFRDKNRTNIAWREISKDRPPGTRHILGNI